MAGVYHPTRWNLTRAVLFDLNNRPTRTSASNWKRGDEESIRREHGVVYWVQSSIGGPLPVPASSVFGGRRAGGLMKRLQIRVNRAVGEIANLLRFPDSSVPRLCHPCEADRKGKTHGWQGQSTDESGQTAQDRTRWLKDRFIRPPSPRRRAGAGTRKGDHQITTAPWSLLLECASGMVWLDDERRPHRSVAVLAFRE